jgi:hypothetical protein
LADKALERADRAKSKAAGWAADRVEQWQPGIYSALDRVPPAVGKAHRTLEDKVIPGLVDALHQASGQPIVVVEPAPRRRVGRTIFRIALAGALLATVALVIKTWLSESKRSPWSAHEPHEAYVYPDDNPTASPQASEFETDSYIGPNPPEGFTIKANARSKKYHLPGAPNYDRTIAEVWFPTEEAAQAAGFTKAEG